MDAQILDCFREEQRESINITLIKQLTVLKNVTLFIVKLFLQI